MKIVVGLGNPGKEYENTKHNLGFMFIDYITQKYSLNGFKKFKSSEILETSLNNEKVVLIKPQTFMNLSGKSVLEVKNWYKVQDSDIIIIYDDFDILFGTVRFREKGTPGTHNGMRNISSVLSTNDIARIRIGTGGIKKENEELISFVLSKFSKVQLQELDNVFELADEKLKEFLDKSRKKC